MKKRLTTVLLAAGMAFAMAGCASGTGQTAGAASTASGESASGAASTAPVESVSEASGENALGTASKENTSQGARATRVIVDHTGREVEIPAEINRVVISSIWPLPSVYCLFEGSADKLVGMHPSSMAAAKNSMLPKVMPDIVNVNTDFLQGGELNIEELLKLKPDVVFYSANNKDEYEKLSAAGIPAIGFSTSNWDYDCVATFENWVKLLGDVLNQQDKAAGIAEYGHQVYSEVQSVMDKAENIEKPRVLILFMYSDGVIKTSGSHFFGQYWIDATGGVNVAADLKGTPEINMEQVYEWNPDIVYITNFSPYQPEDLYNNAIEGNDWSSVKAVREGKVYKFPLGMYRWFPPASDTPLVLKWMAQKNQPELFSDVDMNKEVRDYYKQFYHVDLTDDDLYQIFHPSREAAGK